MYTELEPERNESTFVDNMRFGAKVIDFVVTRLATRPPLRSATKSNALRIRFAICHLVDIIVPL